MSSHFFFCSPPFLPKYLLAEDLRLASVDAETILEADELLGTMQDYLDSSVISIIEDFSSLTEVWNALVTQSVNVSESLYELLGKAICVGTISLLVINIVNQGNQANLLPLSIFIRLPRLSGAQLQNYTSMLTAGPD